MKIRHYILVVLLMLVENAYCQLQINEIMQSNIDCTVDDMNEFPDSWVELKNTGDNPADLGEFTLGESEEKQWQLPSEILNPGDYKIIYCDKVATGSHADFKLDSGKGVLFLMKSGELVDKINYAKQQAPNTAYGRAADEGQFGLLCVATPGSVNSGLAAGMLGEVMFSTTGRVFESESELVVSLLKPDDSPEGTEIRYTIDGSEPTKDSELYSQSLAINNTTVVRAKLFKENYCSQRSRTESYIFLGRNMTLPVVSIVSNYYYFYDPHFGIYVAGNYSTEKSNYRFNWRRPINVEYFESPEVGGAINQLCETRIHGGATRWLPLKSLALYSGKRFGKKRFEHEFFPNQRPGLSDFKSLVLRNAGNDFNYLYMRDAVVQRTMSKNVDIDWTAYQPCIVYLNGSYIGILNLRERSNEDNIYSNYGGLTDIDLIENWTELKEGSWDAYIQLETALDEGVSFEEVKEQIDFEEYINLMIMNLYYDNKDFPGNNSLMWRARKGGKWRFMAKDLDYSIGLMRTSPNYKTIHWFYTPDYDEEFNWANKPEHTKLFRQLMAYDDFKNRLVEKAAIFMGAFMNIQGTSEVLDDFYSKIQYEYPIHREQSIFAKNYYAVVTLDYEAELEYTKEWLVERTDCFYQELCEYYGCGTPVPLHIRTSEQNTPFTFNGINIRNGLFDGKFFLGHQMNIAAPICNKWKVTTFCNGIKTENYYDEVVTMNMPLCDSLTIECVDVSTMIKEVNKEGTKVYRDGGKLVIDGIEKGKNCTVYSMTGYKLYEGYNSEKIEIQLPRTTFVIVRVGDKIKKI